MKFIQFLNEAPRIDDMLVGYKPSLVEDFFEVITEDHDKKTTWKFKEYTITEFERDKQLYCFLGNKKNQLLYIMYDVSDTPLGKSYTNKYVQKGKISIGKNLIADFIYANAKRNKCNVIISDTIQSSGGVSMWKNLLKTSFDEGSEIGIYRNNDKKNSFSLKKGEHIDFIGDKIDTFDKWYDVVKDMAYGKETAHENTRIYIKE